MLESTQYVHNQIRMTQNDTDFLSPNAHYIKFELQATPLPLPEKKSNMIYE